MVSHLITLDGVEDAFGRLRRGEGDRSVVIVAPDLAGAQPGVIDLSAIGLTHLDGLIGEGWSGVDPDGAHVNVVLAERGSATAASLLGTFTSPAPGHAPILVVVGATKAEYEPVWPPTIMINKETALEDRHQTITWGAGQLGIGQGVLDAVAEGLIPLTGDLVVFVTIYIDPSADDESAVRTSASRAATLKGIRTRRPRTRPGRGPRAGRAPRLGPQPVLRWPVVKITAVRLERLSLELDPPFFAAWDPSPRTHFDATVVRVQTDEGVTGIASGDTMSGFEEFAELFVGRDPFALAVHARTLETISFHAGRYWPLEAALWDLCGKAMGVPVATLLGWALRRR